MRKKHSCRLMAAAVCLLVIAGLLFDWWSDRKTWVVLQSSAVDSPSVVGDSGTDGMEHGQNHGSSQAGVTSPEAALIPIYLVGAVQRPGIYQVEPGCYLYQLVEQAGGLTEKAAADKINLAMQLDYNQQIYIPTFEEVSENPSILQSGTADLDRSPLVDLNRAGQSDLEKLPGIGPVTAKAILEYREKNGPFSVPEDLMLVPGIKESRFAALEDHIMVSGLPR